MFVQFGHSGLPLVLVMLLAAKQDNISGLDNVKVEFVLTLNLRPVLDPALVVKNFKK